jgi:hypothetical protein
MLVRQALLNQKEPRSKDHVTGHDLAFCLKRRWDDLAPCPTAEPPHRVRIDPYGRQVDPQQGEAMPATVLPLGLCL